MVSSKTTVNAFFIEKCSNECDRTPITAAAITATHYLLTMKNQSSSRLRTTSECLRLNDRLSRQSLCLAFLLMSGCGGGGQDSPSDVTTNSSAPTTVSAKQCVTPPTINQDADLIVIGATSSGVAAAVEAARHCLKVILVERTGHVGGMSSNGLSNTDIGNAASVGGISKEVYQKIGAHYGKAVVYNFEPHVAENVFEDLLSTTGVKVVRNTEIQTVNVSNQKIVSVVSTGGTSYTAKYFIDSTYEGDLLSSVNVSKTVGRESNSQYKETYNGIRPAYQDHGLSVDPYVVPGTPSSGLLPHVTKSSSGVVGSADQRIMAYNYRLCLTKDTSNKIPVMVSPAYHSDEFELLARYSTALQKNSIPVTINLFLGISELQNNKYDINNSGFFSTDYVGLSSSYPSSSQSQRRSIDDEHQRYIRDLLTFLATDHRIPASIRTEVGSYGLCKDEFVDNAGWPRILYVRESVRMASDYVMTESNLTGALVASDSIGLGSYPMDSHIVTRFAAGGNTQIEGLQSASSLTYPISYHSIIPKSGEIQNLLVTVCVSASHVAFDSMRTEPTYMIMGHAAGAAAALAVAHGVNVQDVSYAELKAMLTEESQILQ